MTRALLHVGAIFVAACHSSATIPDDADVCWPSTGTTTSGSVELGTGEAMWIVLPNTLQLQSGSQGAAFLYMNARVQGIEPGDPTDFLAANNPRTRIQATLVDGTVVGGDCPSRIGYAPNTDGYDYWAAGEMLVFLPFTAEQAASNANVTLTLEVIDSAMHYAKDQKTIFVTPRNTGGSGSGSDL